MALVRQAQAEGDLQAHLPPDRLAQWGVPPREARRELLATLDALVDDLRRRP